MNYDVKISDIDKGLIKQYKEILGNPDITTEQLLSSRGFMREQNREKYLTNSAVLLFVQNVYQFYPNCRIRFVRYGGTYAGVGTQMNIIKDANIEYIVTVDNIRTTNFSRNPRMARVLADFGIVKELNQGVKRIYSDMEDYFLDAPEYSEPSGQTVKLVLRNNIIARTARQSENTEKKMAKYWDKLDAIEKDIVTIMGSRNYITATELSVMISKTRRTVNKKINHLMKLEIIKMNGNKHDPTLTYSLNI